MKNRTAAAAKPFPIFTILVQKIQGDRGVLQYNWRADRSVRFALQGFPPVQIDIPRRGEMYGQQQQQQQQIVYYVEHGEAAGNHYAISIICSTKSHNSLYISTTMAS